MKQFTSFIKQFVSDKTGKVVLFQAPNLALWGWIICRLVTLLFSKSSLSPGINRLGTAFIFTWAYLELTSGVNYFRRTLGAVVLAMTAWGLLH